MLSCLDRTTASISRFFLPYRWDRKGDEEIDLVCEDELGGEIAFYDVKRDPKRFSDSKLQAKIAAFFSKNPEKRNLRHTSGLLSLSDM